MTKRSFNIGTSSTYEIKRRREEESKQQNLKLDEDAFEEFKPMTANQMQDYVLRTKNEKDMNIRLLLLRTFQMERADLGFLKLLELHGMVRFRQLSSLKTFLKECITQFGSSYVQRIVRYISNYCFAQKELQIIDSFKKMLSFRADVDWNDVFHTCLNLNPKEELQLLSAMIMLLPKFTSKQAARVFTLIGKETKLPGCFEWLAKTAFQANSWFEGIDKKDFERVIESYLEGVYASSSAMWKENSHSDAELKDLQKQFLEKTVKIVNKGFGVINEGDKNAVNHLMQNPCFQMEQPSKVFIEYFIQYVKLGMFSTKNGDKLIAWNYYYDDRWCGYDRGDLFGKNFELSEMFHYSVSFKYAGVIKQHAHHHNLMLCSKTFGWMSEEETFFNAMMEKYGDEDFLQYLFIALSFAGCFDKVIELFEKYSATMESRQGFMSSHICYMYACAKKGTAKECIEAWVRVMEKSIRWGFLKSLNFTTHSFHLPPFVDIKNSGQFATRLLRNCLWTSALNDPISGWKKYGLIILNLCETLEDSFLNHNMTRIMFQKMKKEELPMFFAPDFEQCIVHRSTYIHMLEVLEKHAPEVLAEIADRLPRPTVFPPTLPNPGFVLVYRKLKEKNQIFENIIESLSEEVFKEEEAYEEENLEEEKPKVILEQDENETDEDLSRPTTPSETSLYSRRSLSRERPYDPDVHAYRESQSSGMSNELEDYSIIDFDAPPRMADIEKDNDDSYDSLVDSGCFKVENDEQNELAEHVENAIEPIGDLFEDEKLDEENVAAIEAKEE